MGVRLKYFWFSHVKRILIVIIHGRIIHDVTLVDITSTDGGHLAELTLESG